MNTDPEKPKAVPHLPERLLYPFPTIVTDLLFLLIAFFFSFYLKVLFTSEWLSVRQTKPVLFRAATDTAVTDMLLKLSSTPSKPPRGQILMLLLTPASPPSSVLRSQSDDFSLLPLFSCFFAVKWSPSPSHAAVGLLFIPLVFLLFPLFLYLAGSLSERFSCW